MDILDHSQISVTMNTYSHVWFTPALQATLAGVLNEELSRRLEEAGVSASGEQLEELATAYQALREWIAIAERLGRGEPQIPEPP